jgi:copper chaperone CopZ
MQTNLKSSSFRIGGMTCVNCQNRIEKKLKSTAGVEDARVNFNTGSAVVSYNEPAVTVSEIAAVIEELGYKVLGDKAGKPVPEILGTLVIILALYMLLRAFGLSTIASAFPLAEAGMGYGMLLVIGLVTSAHCAAMCGGINLSQCIAALGGTAAAGQRLRVLVPAILYNTGRVISYTAVGIAAGALGQVISVSGRFRGIVQLAAGIFMVIMGLNMLGIFQGPLGTWLRRFNPRLPKIFAKKPAGKARGTKTPSLSASSTGSCPAALYRPCSFTPFPQGAPWPEGSPCSSLVWERFP